MRINLNEIPQDGAFFHLNRTTGELNEVLNDLIGNHSYKVDLSIFQSATKGHFTLTGTVSTSSNEACSRCGIDFDLSINEKFQELLLPELSLPRDGHYAKSNHYSDTTQQGPSVHEYSGHHFELGEYIHEVIGLAIPFTPAPPVNPEGKCSTCHLSIKNQSFSYDEPMSIEKAKSPFSVLEVLKSQPASNSKLKS